MTAGQVWLTWALLTKKDTELSKQLQLDVSAPASQKLDTDWTVPNTGYGWTVVCLWNMILTRKVQDSNVEGGFKAGVFLCLRWTVKPVFSASLSRWQFHLTEISGVYQGAEWVNETDLVLMGASGSRQEVSIFVAVEEVREVVRLDIWPKSKGWGVDHFEVTVGYFAGIFWSGERDANVHGDYKACCRSVYIICMCVYVCIYTFMLFNSVHECNCLWLWTMKIPNGFCHTFISIFYFAIACPLGFKKKFEIWLCETCCQPMENRTQWDTKECWE